MDQKIVGTDRLLVPDWMRREADNRNRKREAKPLLKILGGFVILASVFGFWILAALMVGGI